MHALARTLPALARSSPRAYEPRGSYYLRTSTPSPPRPRGIQPRDHNDHHLDAHANRFKQISFREICTRLGPFRASLNVFWMTFTRKARRSCPWSGGQLRSSVRLDQTHKAVSDIICGLSLELWTRHLISAARLYAAHSQLCIAFCARCKRYVIV